MTVDIIIPIFYVDQSLFIPIEMCFSTLHACYPWFNVIAINDASPLELPPHWDVTDENATNMGYTATVNRGLALSSADVVIVCNDDIQFFPGCLDRFFSLPDMVIASPADTASGDLESFGSIFGMTRKTLEVMGLLDERFKHFYSDTEYRDRASRLGVETVKWRDIVLAHPESSTFNLLGTKDELLASDREIWESGA